MAEEILRPVREGLDVCAAFYGHPGVFVNPSHDAIARARAEGYRTRMLPAVSAEDCLFADLGVDPCRSGCQSYEATNFLVHRRRVDSTAALVLWQIGTVGNVTAAAEARPSGLPVLVETLLELYPPDHEVVVYEASPYPGFDPLVRAVALSELAADEVDGDVDALRPAASVASGRRHDAGAARFAIVVGGTASRPMSSRARSAATTFPFCS